MIVGVVYVVHEVVREARLISERAEGLVVAFSALVLVAWGLVEAVVMAFSVVKVVAS